MIQDSSRNLNIQNVKVISGSTKNQTKQVIALSNMAAGLASNAPTTSRAK